MFRPRLHVMLRQTRDAVVLHQNRLLDRLVDALRPDMTPKDRMRVAVRALRPRLRRLVPDVVAVRVLLAVGDLNPVLRQPVVDRRLAVFVRELLRIAVDGDARVAGPLARAAPEDGLALLGVEGLVHLVDRRDGVGGVSEPLRAFRWRTGLQVCDVRPALPYRSSDRGPKESGDE